MKRIYILAIVLVAAVCMANDTSSGKRRLLYGGRAVVTNENERNEKISTMEKKLKEMEQEEKLEKDKAENLYQRASGDTKNSMRELMKNQLYKEAIALYEEKRKMISTLEKIIENLLIFAILFGICSVIILLMGYVYWV